MVLQFYVYPTLLLSDAAESYPMSRSLRKSGRHGIGLDCPVIPFGRNGSAQDKRSGALDIRSGSLFILFSFNVTGYHTVLSSYRL